MTKGFGKLIYKVLITGWYFPLVKEFWWEVSDYFDTKFDSVFFVCLFFFVVFFLLFCFFYMFVIQIISMETQRGKRRHFMNRIWEKLCMLQTQIWVELATKKSILKTMTQTQTISVTFLSRYQTQNTNLSVLHTITVYPTRVGSKQGINIGIERIEKVVMYFLDTLHIITNSERIMRSIYSKRSLSPLYPSGLSVCQWSGRPGFNPRLRHTKDFKNGTWYLLA